jgi:hypothetical protein
MKPIELSTFASLLLALGCGSSDDAGQSRPCASETLVLQGDLDGHAIDVAWPLGSFAVIAAPGDASAQFGTQGNLKLGSASTLEPGATVDATGTLVLPTESPVRPGETLCVGAGSSMTRVPEQGLYVATTFSLTNLASGGSCETPLLGTLEGCFAHAFEED